MTSMTGWDPLDLSKPGAARVYDALLGGSSGFAADRDQAQALTRICPGLPALARDNRAFLDRAVTWVARQGIRQFLDLGAGLPVRPPLRNTHQAARDACPAARVAYADRDPVAAVHGRVLAGDGVAYAEADIAGPAAVLARPDVRAVIDPAEPVCVILGLVPNLFPAQKARQVVAGYAALAAPGSCFAVSCFRCDDAALWRQLREAHTAAPAWNHAPRTIAGFLGGLELVPPGLVPVQNWRGGWHDVPTAPPGPAYVLGAVAGKR
jgi:hypothetical protein